jgi:hypothetical protein
VDLLIRFLVGGAVVSAFAIVGGLFKPPSFAGIFGAAPSVALATIALTVSKEGGTYAAAECHSMIAGAAALFLYSFVVRALLKRFRFHALKATLSSMPVWFLAAFVLWQVFLQ